MSSESSDIPFYIQPQGACPIAESTAAHAVPLRAKMASRIPTLRYPPII